MFTRTPIYTRLTLALILIKIIFDYGWTCVTVLSLGVCAEA